MSKVIEIKSYVWQSAVACNGFSFAIGSVYWVATGFAMFPFAQALATGLVLSAVAITAIVYMNEKVRTETVTETYGQTQKVKGPAGHEMGYELRVGTLVLTGRNLWFISNGLNLQNADLKIDISDIKSVQPKSLFGLFPNTISVELEDGGMQEFVVPDREAWLAELSKIGGSEMAA
nr:hypothetical protein [uncultured organism]